METLTEGRVERELVSAVCSPLVFWVQRLERTTTDAPSNEREAQGTGQAKGKEADNERPARLVRLEADLTRDAESLEPMRPALLVPGAFCLAYDAHSKTYAVAPIACSIYNRIIVPIG